MTARRCLPRRIVGTIAAAAVLVLSPIGQATAERALETLANTDLPGADYATLRNVPLAECRRECLADDRCGAFTYNGRVNWCFLKREAGERVPYDGATSAIVVEQAPAQALDLPDLAFLPPDVVPEANRLRGLAAAARRTNETVSLVTPAAASAVASNGTDAWLGFARRLLSTDYDRWSDRTEAAGLAAAAGYLGLSNATSTGAQADALSVISAALERQRLFRPAIEASRASLALAYDRTEQSRLTRLRAEHGFRVLDYSVDAETRSPRMCVQFSEPLAGDAADLERFVSVSDLDGPTVSVEDRQLCVEGLDHGTRYNVALREGLPSTVGERLRTTARFRVYVRDRAPTARFESNVTCCPPLRTACPSRPSTQTPSL